MRIAVYRSIVERAAVPLAAEVASGLRVAEARTRAAFERLAAARVLVLDRAGEIRMAHPFAAAGTAHAAVNACGRWNANCAWDAIGIAGVLGEAVTVETVCGGSGEPMRLEVGTDGRVAGEEVLHFAVPAARWWDDIGHT